MNTRPVRHLNYLLLILILQFTASCSTNSHDRRGNQSPYSTSQLDTVLRYELTGSDCPFAEYAEYGIWIPGGEKPIRGIMVLQHGCTMEAFGITKPYDLQFRAFARKWNLAILETALHGNCQVWVDPASGSGNALLIILARAAADASRPEIAKAPWLMWGHSGGGCWTLAMIRDYPERIRAAVCYSAAFDPQWDYPPEAARIPVLLRHTGATDYPGCDSTAIHAFSKMRALDGLTSIVFNRGENHNYSSLRHMMIPFFEGALKNPRPRRTWLGDTLTFAVFPESRYKGDKAALCRFPDKSVAMAWSEYASTNDVADLTAPPSPRRVKVTEMGDSLRVSWMAESDPESGIRCFQVYLDGSLAARLPESGEYQSFNRNGDNTFPLNPPEMTVVIPRPDLKRYRICVESTNQAGLTSRSSILTVR